MRWFRSEKTTESKDTSTNDDSAKKPAAVTSYAKASQTMQKTELEPIKLEGAMARLFSVCGNTLLFSPTALKVLTDIKIQLESLLKEYPDDMITAEDMKRTKNSIVLLTELLDNLCKNDKPGVFNNLNYFISATANAFYKSLGDNPSINDELAAHAAQILLRALKENNLSAEIFPGTLSLTRGAYVAYTKVNGDQLQIAANYLRAKLEVYIDARDNVERTALMESVKNMNYHAHSASDFAKERKFHGRSMRSFDNVASTFAKATFQFQADATGFPAVAAGAVLKSLAQCQSEMTSNNVIKPGISETTFINVTIPSPASESQYNNLKSKIVHFDANLLKECDRICSKPSSEEERKIFDDLRVKLRELQPKDASVQNIAQDLISRYALVEKAIKNHAIWNANPQATSFLKACAAELKDMMSHYSLDMTAKELSASEKTALSQPAPTVQAAQKAEKEPEMAENKSLNM